MGAEVDQQVHLGEFTCSLDMLGKLLGLSDHAVIHHIEMTPMAILGVPSCRIVVEDQDLPPVSAGVEISRVAPYFTVRDTTYRKFNGWKGISRAAGALEPIEAGL